MPLFVQRDREMGPGGGRERLKRKNCVYLNQLYFSSSEKEAAVGWEDETDYRMNKMYIYK